MLGELLRAARGEGRPILFTGCGTSEHAARACAAIAAAALPEAVVAARDAFEVQLAPPGDALVVAISHDGGTASTLATTSAAPRAALITARPGGQGAGVEPIVTPRHDESWCHTVAYISPMLTVALGLGAIAVEAAAVIAAELEARAARPRAAEQLGGATRLLAVGSGVDAITASELALKIEEAAYVPTTPLGTEKVLHGHLPAADASTGVVLLRFDPSYAAARDARAANVVAATAVLGMPAVTLSRRRRSTRCRRAAGGRGRAPTAHARARTRARTNPDLIRREQDPYRARGRGGRRGLSYSHSVSKARLTWMSTCRSGPSPELTNGAPPRAARRRPRRRGPPAARRPA